MIKAICIRLAGLLLGLLAAAPAAISILKSSPLGMIRFFRGLYVPLWWWKWAWGWMPAIPFPMERWHDLIWSLPGIIAALAVGIGLSMAFGKRRKKVIRSWEGKP